MDIRDEQDGQKKDLAYKSTALKPAIQRFLVMSAIPDSGCQLYSEQVPQFGQVFGQGIGIIAAPVVNTIHVVDTYDRAHDLAKQLSALYNCPYYVAGLSVEGRYVPPPPQFVPVFEC